MDDRYEAFCIANAQFYDVPHAKNQAPAAFGCADRALPDGWRRDEQGEWLVFVAPGADPPMQGWKIHVSARLDNADRVLDAVWDYCVPRDIRFKFLRSKSALMMRSSKYAPRGHSGKLVTIYPTDDAACETILRELGTLLDGEPGPYILSDLRWGNGPLYVRYGGFVGRYCPDDTGHPVPAITDDTGALVPDRRDPVFHVPPWVTLPDFLSPHLAARNAVTVADLPYTVDRVMHYSNGGGLYRGRDTRTGKEVVLKEARPYAGLDALRRDAVTRLEREYAMLQRLAGIPGIPKVYDLFSVGEHRFMAMEYVDGVPLQKAMVRRYPLSRTAGPDEFASYTAWALATYDRVKAAVAAMHERGVIHGDLHVFNMMVRPDDSVALLDFEVASLVEENLRPGLGNQGFVAPRGTTGTDIDRYAVACLQVMLFLPLTQLLWLSRPKVYQFAEVIAEHFPVPAEFLAEAVETIVAIDEKATTRAAGDRKAVGAPEPTSARRPQSCVKRERLAWAPEAWPALRAELARAILASASPDRDDRLFPGDIEQFRLGGLGLAYGAAGVLYALSVTGAGRHPELEEWLLRHVRQARGTMRGLYDGLHGVAFTLEHLGHRQEALDTLDRCLRDDWQELGTDLLGGLAGIGLNLAHFAERTGEPEFRSAGARAAELVAERLGDVDSVATVSGHGHPYAGLLRGSSGPALLLIRAYDDTGDKEFLNRAAVALRQDLRRCVVRDDGTMQVTEGWRTMPYLAVGSVGIGFALDEYLARRHDDEFADASRAIRLVATSRLYAQSGLFAGRAGMLLYLAGRAAEPGRDPDVADQLRRLAWHALPYADGVAFPGEQLLRLSMDLATGTAGVLLAVGAACHGAPVHLPLLAPTVRATKDSRATPARVGVPNVLEEPNGTA